MNRIGFRILLLLVCKTASVAEADGKEPDRMFSGFDNKDNFEYVYVSPRVIEMYGKEAVSDIPADKVSFVEIITSDTQGNDSDLKNAISETIERNGLALQCAKDNNKRKYNFYGRWDDERAVYTHLLLIKQNAQSPDDISLMYMEGNFALGDICKLF